MRHVSLIEPELAAGGSSSASIKEKMRLDQKLRVKNKVLNDRGDSIQREANGEGVKVKRHQRRARRYNGILGSMKVAVNVEKICNPGMEVNIFFRSLSWLRGKRNERLGGVIKELHDGVVFVCDF